MFMKAFWSRNIFIFIVIIEQEFKYYLRDEGMEANPKFFNHISKNSPMLIFACFKIAFRVPSGISPE